MNRELTQKELGDACGVSQGTVAQWEKGLCFPKAEKLQALSRVLECDVDVLLKIAERRKVGA